MADYKRCPKCGKTKHRKSFHKNAARRDGLADWCKACTKERVNDYNARQRLNMGEEEYRAHKTQLVREHRARNKDSGKAYNAARRRAVTRLILLHRAEFDALLAEERGVAE